MLRVIHVIRKNRAAMGIEYNGGEVGWRHWVGLTVKPLRRWYLSRGDLWMWKCELRSGWWKGLRWKIGQVKEILIHTGPELGLCFPQMFSPVLSLTKSSPDRLDHPSFRPARRLLNLCVYDQALYRIQQALFFVPHSGFSSSSTMSYSLTELFLMLPRLLQVLTGTVQVT